MAQPYPWCKLFRHGQDAPQHVDLQLVEVLIHGRLQERFELVDSIVDLCPRLRIYCVPVGVIVRRAVLGGGSVCEAERCGGGIGQPVFDSGNGAVDELVDGVDDIVQQGLGCVSRWRWGWDRVGLPEAYSGSALSEAK